MVSVVSMRVMPAVNSEGNTRIDQIDNPLEASAAEMPKRPTSVVVSKPSPNRKPNGYMYQLRSISRNSDRHRRANKPPPDVISAKSASPQAPPALMRRKAW